MLRWSRRQTRKTHEEVVSPGAPCLAVSARHGITINNPLLAKAARSGAPHIFKFLGRGWSSFQLQNAGVIDMHPSCLSAEVRAKAAPTPLLGRGHQSVPGAPCLAVSARHGISIDNPLLAKAARSGAPHIFKFLSRGWASLQLQNVGVIDMHRSCLSAEVRAKAAPTPILGRGHQSALDRIAVYVA